MKIPTNSFEIRGPYPTDGYGSKWVYQLYDDGDLVAEAHGATQQAALENALLLAAAPRMADVLEGLYEYDMIPGGALVEIGNTMGEALGTKCEACETLGQPSRMVYSPTNRLYHPTCLPADVKKAIAEEGKAADQAGDIPW